MGIDGQEATLEGKAFAWRLQVPPPGELTHFGTVLPGSLPKGSAGPLDELPPPTVIHDTVTGERFPLACELR